MRFDYTQVFLLVWLIAFWVYYFLTYGKVEGKHERATVELVDTSDSDFILTALKLPFMLGTVGILYGRKQ